MAFGLSAINAYGVEVHQFSTKKFVQVLEMDITGTASDVALDIGNPAGSGPGCRRRSGSDLQEGV